MLNENEIIARLFSIVGNDTHPFVSAKEFNFDPNHRYTCISQLQKMEAEGLISIAQNTQTPTIQITQMGIERAQELIIANANPTE